MAGLHFIFLDRGFHACNVLNSMFYESSEQGKSMLTRLSIPVLNEAISAPENSPHFLQLMRESWAVHHPYPASP